MVVDVGMECSDRRVLRIRLAVGLDNVGLSRDEARGALEVGDRPVEFAHGDVAVAAMTIQPRIVGMQLKAPRVHVDGLANPAEVCEPASEPDDGISICGAAVKPGARFCKLALVPRAGLG